MSDDYQPIRAGAREPAPGEVAPGQPTPGSQATPSQAAAEAREAQWERSLIEKLTMSLIEEKRRARRWGIFFKLVFLVLIVGVALLALGRFGMGGEDVGSTRHTALVDLTGVLDAKGQASADTMIESLQNAFKDKGTAGVILRINSPGGSPVQAGLIHDEILRLRARYPKIPLYVVVEEMCASGGYYVAVAADKIYVDKASLVGSIGVLMDGFGFVGTMDKLGVERRLLTAGKNKGFLDSFSPMNDAQKQYAQTMLDEIHKQFIDVVRKGRGARLKETPDTFSGLFWTGSQSVDMGLADGYGSVSSIARDVIKAEDIVDFSPHDNLAERLARKLGATLADGMVTALSYSGARMQLR